jgi:NADH:ubiquinone oxidoreductase subunit E
VVTISVCVGSSCHLKGSYDVITNLQALIDEHQLADLVELEGTFCLGHCTQAVVVAIDGELFFNLNKDNTEQFFTQEILARVGVP